MRNPMLSRPLDGGHWLARIEQIRVTERKNQRIRERHIFCFCLIVLLWCALGLCVQRMYVTVATRCIACNSLYVRYTALYRYLCRAPAIPNNVNLFCWHWARISWAMERRRFLTDDVWLHSFQHGLCWCYAPRIFFCRKCAI